MPIFSEDDVMNFKVTEAIVHRVALEEKRAKTAQKTTAALRGHKDFAKDMGMIAHAGR